MNPNQQQPHSLDHHVVVVVDWDTGCCCKCSGCSDCSHSHCSVFVAAAAVDVAVVAVVEGDGIVESATFQSPWSSNQYAFETLAG